MKIRERVRAQAREVDGISRLIYRKHCKPDYIGDSYLKNEESQETMDRMKTYSARDREFLCQ
jgi:hypothetical protein